MALIEPPSGVGHEMNVVKNGDMNTIVCSCLWSYDSNPEFTDAVILRHKNVHGIIQVK